MTLFWILTHKLPSKAVYSPIGSKFIPFRVDRFSKGRQKQFERVVPTKMCICSPELFSCVFKRFRQSFDLYCLDQTAPEQSDKALKHKVSIGLQSVS